MHIYASYAYKPSDNQFYMNIYVCMHLTHLMRLICMYASYIGYLPLCYKLSQNLTN